MIREAHPLDAWGNVGARLNTALQNGRIAPAYLIQGVDLDACGALAQTFAAGLVSDSPDAALAARIKSGSHPDVRLITKDKPTVISVASLGEMLTRAHQSPMEGNHQVFVVSPADAMEPAGIARYLKTLEEPPATTVFLLCTRYPERLPATIHSRCASIHVPSEDVATIAEALADLDFDPADIRRAAAFGGGSRSRARLLLERDLLHPVDAFLDGALARPPACARASDTLLAALSQAADGTTGPVRDRDLAEEVLRVIAQILRDRAAGREVSGGAVIAPTVALVAFERVAQCMRALALNVSLRTVVLEAALALQAACASGARRS